jgi:hypothetical protein
MLIRAYRITIEKKEFVIRDFEFDPPRTETRTRDTCTGFLLLVNIDHSDGFPVHPNKDERSYKGCGVRASQAVFDFLGIHRSVDEWKSKFGRFNASQTFGDGIAIFPQTLCDNINDIINDYERSRALGGYRFRARLKTKQSKADITRLLLQYKMPVIALVKGGDHFYTIFGYRRSPDGGCDFWIHDNANNNPGLVWLKESEFSLDVGVWKEILVDSWDWVPFVKDKKWNDGTVIYFEEEPYEEVREWREEDGKREDERNTELQKRLLRRICG